jgi:3-deoxy-D-manno-octulosonate 8-phosphate phosphatase (KDO 8-P phosphatase)
MIKLLICDVDGVLTSGKKTYDHTGLCISKEFCDLDFTAIKKLQACGVKVIWLSGDQNVNESIARNRGIDFYTNKCSGKMTCKSLFLPKFCKNYGVTCDEIAYIGDDIFDIEIMKHVGYVACPVDAAKEVFSFIYNEMTYKQNQIYVSCKSGEGCINEFYYGCLAKNCIKKLNTNEILNFFK